MAVKFNNPDKREEYLRSLDRAPAFVPPAASGTAPLGDTFGDEAEETGEMGSSPD